MIVYVENPKGKLLEEITRIDKRMWQLDVTTINIKYITFPYTTINGNFHFKKVTI